MDGCKPPGAEGESLPPDATPRAAGPAHDDLGANAGLTPEGCALTPGRAQDHIHSFWCFVSQRISGQFCSVLALQHNFQEQ